MGGIQSVNYPSDYPQKLSPNNLPEITATNDNLIIKAKNEKRQRDFKLNLYGAVSVADISCDTENGLLTVTMPKKCVSEKRTIELK